MRLSNEVVDKAPTNAYGFSTLWENAAPLYRLRILIESENDSKEITRGSLLIGGFGKSALAVMKDIQRYHYY